MRNNTSALRSSAPRAFTKSFEPSRAVAKYGVDPRASRLAGSSDASGTPTAARPPAIAVALGRGEGDPFPTVTAVPTNQPHSSATIVSNETGVTTKWVTPTTRTRNHDSRRQRRETHGPTAAA